jgi:hypothetical protein
LALAAAHGAAAHLAWGRLATVPDHRIEFPALLVLLPQKHIFGFHPPWTVAQQAQMQDAAFADCLLPQLFQVDRLELDFLNPSAAPPEKLDIGLTADQGAARRQQQCIIPVQCADRREIAAIERIGEILAEGLHGRGELGIDGHAVNPF